MIDRARAPSGVLRVTLFRGGDLIECSVRDNLVVAGHGTIMALLLGSGAAGKVVTKIGFGSSTAAAAVGNTGLSGDAIFKAFDAVTYPSANQVAFQFSLATGEGIGLSLSEYGLLTVDSTLFARQVRAAPILKDASLSLSATWTISL